MPKYVIQSKTNDTKVKLEYNDDGCLIAYSSSGSRTKEKYMTFFKYFPYLEEHLTIWRSKAKVWKIQVVEQAEDLSFKVFWDQYDYKVGNLQRTTKLWEALSEEDKILALNYLPQLETHLKQNAGQSKPYAETFLKQRRWDM